VDGLGFLKISGGNLGKEMVTVFLFSEGYPVLLFMRLSSAGPLQVSHYRAR
jgi:hypothetical protein